MYWTMKEFVEGFRKLMDHLTLDKVGESKINRKVNIFS